MKLKLVAGVVLISSLSGCAELNDGFNSLNKNLKSLNDSTALKTDKTVSEICHEAGKNPSRANSMFEGMLLTTSGVVSMSGNYVLAKNNFLLKVGNDSVYVNNYPNINSLDNGQKLEVTGRINYISTNFDCLVAIDY